MLAGIREILIITAPEYLNLFKRLLKDGSQWGVNFYFATQDKPEGLAQAFIIGEEFIGDDQVCLILGDNIFHGHELAGMLESAKQENVGATVFSYRVKDPSRFGILEFDKNNNVVGIEEKPLRAKSNYAVTGLYMYDSNVVDVARSIKPSFRGELEITDINKVYLSENLLRVKTFYRGFAWLDAGTPESLLDATQYISLLEKRQGLKISSPEEISWNKKYIDSQQLYKLAHDIQSTNYGQYLLSLLDEESVELKPKLEVL